MLVALSPSASHLGCAYRVCAQHGSAVSGARAACASTRLRRASWGESPKCDLGAHWQGHMAGPFRTGSLTTTCMSLRTSSLQGGRNLDSVVDVDLFQPEEVQKCCGRVRNGHSLTSVPRASLGPAGWQSFDRGIREPAWLALRQAYRSRGSLRRWHPPSCPSPKRWA